MKFEKGKPKTGGRQKGTPNKAKSVKARLEELNFDIIQELYKEINLITEPRDRFAALVKFLEFVEPKLKSVEHSGEINGDHDHKIELNRDNFLDILKAARGKT